MSGQASVQLAVELAVRQRDQARQEVAQAQQVVQFAREQMGQLERYAQETQERWVTQSKDQSTPELMRHYYQFMDKLYEAISLQSQVLLDAGQRLQAREKALLEAEYRLASRESVLAGLRKAASVKQEKVEQKQQDELAAQQHRRNWVVHHGGER